MSYIKSSIHNSDIIFSKNVEKNHDYWVYVPVIWYVLVIIVYAIQI